MQDSYLHDWSWFISSVVWLHLRQRHVRAVAARSAAHAAADVSAIRVRAARRAMGVWHARISGSVVVATAAAVVRGGVGPPTAHFGEVCEGREDPPRVRPRAGIELHLRSTRVLMILQISTVGKKSEDHT